MKIVYLILCIISFNTVAWSQKSETKLIHDSILSKKFVDQGVKSLSRKNYKKALRLFEKAMVENPLDYQAKSYLGVLKYIDQKPEEAIPIFEESMKLFKEHQAVMVREKTLILDRLHRQKMEKLKIGGEEGMKQARPYIEKIEDMKVEIEEDKALIYPSFFRFKYGNALFMLNRIPEAKAQFVLIVNNDPLFTQAYSNLALCYFDEGNMEKAYEYYAMGKEKNVSFHPLFEEKMAQYKASKP